MKKIVKWCTAFAIMGALAGCARTAPVDQIHSTVSTGHTAEQVKSAILKAGHQREWIMSEAGPGVIKGRLQARESLRQRYPHPLFCDQLLNQLRKQPEPESKQWQNPQKL